MYIVNKLKTISHNSVLMGFGGDRILTMQLLQ